MAVYITRGDHWSFESRERMPITKPEWMDFVSTDPDFRPAGTACAAVVSEAGMTFDVHVERPGEWEWIAHPLSPVHLPTFQYNRGGLIIRSPDKHTLEKARQVARALSARLIGDNDEVY